jgi:hypothetical protein
VIAEAYLESRVDVVGLAFVDGSLVGGDPETGVNHAEERAHSYEVVVKPSRGFLCFLFGSSQS